MTTTTPPPRARPPRRWLRTGMLDLLLGPHGVDRYLELVDPALTIHDARARVVAVHRQTPRTVTLSLAPNKAFAGFEAGQFVRVGIEIDGVRRTRTYSPASAPHDRAGTLELTITQHPDGLVSRHLIEHARPGMVLHLAAAQGEFTLPQPRPSRLVLISGGSGITPVLAMARALHAEGRADTVRFVHFARTEADWLYREEVERLGVEVVYATTRGDTPQRLTAETFGDASWAAVCGPPSLVDAARAAWGRDPEHLLTETFRPALISATDDPASGTIRFTRSGIETAAATGSLLEQAEAAGLTPKFGCRMGICHTCTCRKAAGAVRNLRTGEISDEQDEDIQLCVSAPAGDVALEL